MTEQKLTLTEKAGYSCGDAAANFVFMSMILFQLNFYTDVFGLTATAAAAILLWPRFWDAVFDPIMGVLADRTRTRWADSGLGFCGHPSRGQSSWFSPTSLPRAGACRH
jgi:Na+/melibiose symporter-like transporter